jgi:hypothetical protein
MRHYMMSDPDIFPWEGPPRDVILNEVLEGTRDVLERGGPNARLEAARSRPQGAEARFM